jgi:hypothetical protein
MPITAQEAAAIIVAAIDDASDGDEALAEALTNELETAFFGSGSKREAR